MNLLQRIIDAIALLFAFLCGKKVQGLADQNVEQKAELKAEDIYVKAEAEVKMESDINQAVLKERNLADVVSTVSVRLHDDPATISHQITSADLLDVRD